jgi:hypothetical protein
MPDEFPLVEQDEIHKTPLTAVIEESIKSPSVPQDNSEDLIEPAAKSKPASPVFTQSHIKIQSDNVQRFIIAPRVINNEPIGTIEEIKFDKNIAAIFAFTEVTDLKDTALYYDWSLNGEAVTRVRVDVGGQRWRTYSSKIIQPHMRGEWTVEMQNKNGETLAISRFTY